LTAGTRRNGTSKLGPFNRVATGRKAQAAASGTHQLHEAYQPYEPQESPRAHQSQATNPTRQEPWRPQQSWRDTQSWQAPESWEVPGSWQAPEPWEATGTWPAQPWEGQPGQRTWPPQPTAGQPHEDERDALDQSPRDEQEHRSPGATGRHVGFPVKPARKTARKRAGKVVPAAAVAATLAVGAAAYTLFGGGSAPQAAPLNAAQGASGATVSAGAGAGQANGAAGSILKIATASGPGSSGAATHAPSATPSAKPSTSAPAAPVAKPTPQATSAAAATTKAAAGTAGSGSAAQGKAATLSCNLSGGLLPDNVTAIVSFLLAHGYSDNAAAGIAGNIYQESKGNPESVGMGGGGLIGWTPLPSGFVTGNVTADLNTQLTALLTYNQGWAQFLPTLESAASPADAAYIYVTDFERAGIPAATTREAAATDVASACGI
jgi:Phage tail lysozyme